jgi:cell division protease FtsH
VALSEVGVGWRFHPYHRRGHFQLGAFTPIHYVGSGLGGRAAESIVFGELSTGAADDLAKATNIARSMVTRYGMDEKLGMASLESERSTFLPTPGDYAAARRDFSEETAREVDCAVRDLIAQAFERAVGILEAHREVLEDSAQRLLEKETLSGDELPILDVEPDPR